MPDSEDAPQNRFVAQQLEHTRRSSNLRAFGLGGSLARGDADHHSDVDAYLILAQLGDKHLDPASLRSLLPPDVTPIALVDRGWKPGFGRLVQAVIAPLLKIDLNLNDSSSLQSHVMWRARTVLLDKDGLFEQFIAGQRAHWTPERMRDQELETQTTQATVFWLEYLKGCKSLERGEYWSALFYIHRLREMIFTFLRQRLGVRPANPLRPFKRAESDMPEAPNELLLSTVASYSHDSIRSALAQCALLFPRYCSPVPEQAARLALEVVLHTRSATDLDERDFESILPTSFK